LESNHAADLCDLVIRLERCRGGGTSAAGAHCQVNGEGTSQDPASHHGVAIFLARGGKLLEKHDTGCISQACGEEITAVAFEDLDGDGRIDLAAIVHFTGLGGVGEGGKRMEIDSEDGLLLLQKPDGSFAAQPLGLMQLGKSSKCELAALNKSKPLTLKAVRAGFRCDAKTSK
jgi:hypothetical protein